MNRTACRLFCGILAVSFLLGVSVTALGADHTYIGSNKCKMCHLKEYKSWSQTAMATAFEVLKPGQRAEQKTAAGLDANKDYTTDEKCVRCHVTGWGKPGGFKSFEATPELAGVGCEMCHGPGGTYTKKEHMSLQNKEYKKADLVAVGMVGTVSEQQCLGCHNNESPFVGPDFVFDFEAKKSEGTHENFPLKYEH